MAGIDYYKGLIPKLVVRSVDYRKEMVAQLEEAELWLRNEEGLAFE